MLGLAALAFGFFAFFATRRSIRAELENDRIRTSTGFFETANQESVYVRPRKPPAPLVFLFDIKVPDETTAFLVVRHGEPEDGQPPVILKQPIRGMNLSGYESGHTFSFYLQRRKNGWWSGYDSATQKSGALMIEEDAFDWIEESWNEKSPFNQLQKWQDVVEIAAGETVEVFSLDAPNSKKQLRISVYNPKK